MKFTRLTGTLSLGQICSWPDLIRPVP